MAAKVLSSFIIIIFFFFFENGDLKAMYRDRALLDDDEGEDVPPAIQDPLHNRLLKEQINSIFTPKKKYKCLSCDFPYCKEGLPCHDALKCWKYIERDSNGTVQFSRGCITNTDQVGFICGPQQIKTDSHNKKQFLIECCSGDYCNNGSFPYLPPNQFIGEDSGMGGYIIGVLAGFLLVGIVLGGVGIAWLRRSHRKQRLASALRPLSSSPDPLDDIHATPVGDSTLREYLDGSVTSGSGSGLPLLVQRTLCKQVNLIEAVGRGRYGEVWKGVFHASPVAVKIFLSRDEASWTRETEIYSTILLRHENILGYIGSDMTSYNSCTQLWLVTHYHAPGSLYDHLNRATLTHSHMFLLAISMMNGIVHLHTEIFGTQGKPAIAHRDIKTKNILVKSNGTCAIADFGLAVTLTPGTGEAQVPPNPRVGTKRYMSPELLDETIDIKCFEALRRVDVYAVGLVLWEIGRRVVSNGIVEEYQPPFYDRVPSDPSFEDMRKIVCVDQQRPMLPNRWSSDPVLSGLGKVIRECWHQNPNARLPALRVKKTLIKLASQNNIQT